MKRFSKILFCVSIIFIFQLSTFNSLQAQNAGVRGRVVDKRTGENIEYANIALLKASDSSLVSTKVGSIW